MFLILLFDQNLPLSVCCQGDVWICMELMDTSLDKFYKKVIEKGLTIPEDILGKIAVSVRSLPSLPVKLQPNMLTHSRYVTHLRMNVLRCYR